MEMILSFLSFMLLFNHLNGIPQFTTCPSDPVCLSQPVTYECNSGAASLTWIVLDANGDRVGDPVPYTGFSNAGATDSIGGQFNTVLINNTNPLGANITFTPTLSMNNYIVQCGAAPGTLVNCSVVIADIPPAPIPGNITFYSDRLTFSWSPSTSPCLSHYNVNVTSIEYTISTTDTSLSLPVPSTNDTEYSISVVAVDTGGRYNMDPVDEKTFVADVPESVTNLTLNQTGLSIDVSWDEPPVLMFLPLLSYIIYPNVADLNNNITIPAPTNTYNIPDATMGSIYTVGVAASNVLGIGVTTSAMINIISTFVHISSTVPVIHSTILITTRGTTQSTLPSLAISSTRITSPIPTSTCTPTTEQCTPAVFTNCPTSPLCINELVTYQCRNSRIDTSGGANALQWRVLNTTGSILGAITYVSGSSLGSMGSIGTQFTTNLTSAGGSSIVSNITFTTTMNINNYTVECRALVQSGITFTLVGTNTCPILIQDKPPEEKSWSVSPWNQCFPDCHRGIRNRTVVCITVSTRMIMDGCSPPPPPSEETCHERGPCTQWVARPWSVCSKSCGVGYQVRRIKCQATYDSSITLDDAQCLTARPPIFRYCNIQDCPCNESNFCKLIVKTGLCWRAQYQKICRCTCGHAQ